MYGAACLNVVDAETQIGLELNLSRQLHRNAYSVVVALNSLSNGPPMELIQAITQSDAEAKALKNEIQSRQAHE